MASLRFDSEQEYQRFLIRYQHRQKTHNEARRATRTTGNELQAKPEDKAIVLLRAIQASGLRGLWYREFTFHEQRNWRLDVACPHYPGLPQEREKLGCEIDGGIHRVKGKFLRDMEKHNALTTLGWRWIRCTPAQVENGEALVLLQALVRAVG
jgi:very-short-patch-repair endonuclease